MWVRQVWQPRTFDYHLHREPILIINGESCVNLVRLRVEPVELYVVNSSSRVLTIQLIKSLHGVLIFDVLDNGLREVVQSVGSEHPSDTLTVAAVVAERDDDHKGQSTQAVLGNTVDQ